MSRVIWKESSDPADFEVTDTSSLDLPHLKSLFCLAENLFLVSKWYSLDHWLSRSAHRFRWPSHLLVSLWTSWSHWLGLLYLFFLSFSICCKRKQSHILKVPCYQKKWENNGSIGNSRIHAAQKALNISWQSFVGQRITKTAEEDFLDKILFMNFLAGHEYFLAGVVVAFF